MSDNGPTQMLLQALASHPGGLTTPQLAEAIGGQLNYCGNAMRRHERLGRAARAGTASGRRAPVVIWQITEYGAQWLAYRALNGLRKAEGLAEAEARAHDVQVAVARMIQFHRGRAGLAAMGFRQVAQLTARL